LKLAHPSGFFILQLLITKNLKLVKLEKT
jgi:hypothetical protein